MLRRATGLIPLLLLGLVLGLHYWDPAPVGQIRNLVFDSYQRISPRPNDPQASPAVIVDIDDRSLERHGQWPWPRTLLADMVDRLAAAGAAAIVFDIVFAEPDRTSPENAVRYWPDTPEVEALRGLDLPSNDAVFARSIARAPVVTAFAPAEGLDDVPVKEAPYVFVGDDPREILRDYSGAAVTLPMLDRPAAGRGAINLDFSRGLDSVVRRIPLLVQVDGGLYHTLPVEALRVAFGMDSVPFKSTRAQGETAYGGSKAIVAAQFGGRIEVPTDPGGRLILYSSGHDPGRYLPAADVLDGSFDPARVRGRIVLVGTSAQGLLDLRSSPVSPVIPGVELHAEAIEQIVQQQFLERPDWALGAERGYLLVLGLLIFFLVPRVGAAWSAAFGLAMLGAVVAASWYAFGELGWLTDPIYPSLGVVLVFVSSTVIVYLRSDAERRKVRSAFSRYLSPELVERLAAHPERLSLGGEMREMTLLFCDIRGFTTISEQFEAQELTGFINRFLTPMTDIILRRRGTIDKYMGDAIMAFWNAPLDDAAHAENACRAALEMTDTLRGLNEQWRAQAEEEGRTFHEIRIGVGLNTGECCVGNMGSDQRFDYSVIGDAVNLASRLEGLTKTFGVEIIVGETTAGQVPHFALLELGTTQVKGKTQPVRIFALAGDEAVAGSPEFAALRERHAAMMASIEEGRDDEVPRLAAACREAAPPRLAAAYDHFAQRQTAAVG